MWKQEWLPNWSNSSRRQPSQLALPGCISLTTQVIQISSSKVLSRKWTLIRKRHSREGLKLSLCPRPNIRFNKTMTPSFTFPSRWVLMKSSHKSSWLLTKERRRTKQDPKSKMWLMYNNDWPPTPNTNLLLFNKSINSLLTFNIESITVLSSNSKISLKL